MKFFQTFLNAKLSSWKFGSVQRFWKIEEQEKLNLVVKIFSFSCFAETKSVLCRQIDGHRASQVI